MAVVSVETTIKNIYSIALRHYENGDYMRCIEMAFHAIDMGLDNVNDVIDCLLLISEAYEDIGETDMAIQKVKEALRLDPNAQRSLMRMVRLLDNLGEYLGSRDYYYALANVDPEPILQEEATSIILNSPAFLHESEDEPAFRVVDKNERKFRMLDSCRMEFVHSGVDAAAKAYAEVADIFPNDPDVLTSTAFAHVMAGDFKSARRFATRLVANQPESIDGACIMLMIADCNENEREQRRWRKILTDKLTEDFDELVRMCSCLDNSGAYKQTYRLIDAHEEEFGLNSAYLKMRAISEYNIGYHEDAQETMNIYFRLYGEDSFIRKIMAMVLEFDEHVEIRSFDSVPANISMYATQRLLAALELPKAEFSALFRDNADIRFWVKIAAYSKEERIIEMLFERLTSATLKLYLDFFKALSEDTQRVPAIIRGLIAAGILDHAGEKTLGAYTHQVYRVFKPIKHTPRTDEPPIFNKAYHLAFGIAMQFDTEFELPLYTALLRMLRCTQGDYSRFKDCKLIAACLLYAICVFVTDDQKSFICEILGCDMSEFYKYLNALNETEEFVSLDEKDLWDVKLDRLMFKHTDKWKV